MTGPRVGSVRSFRVGVAPRGIGLKNKNRGEERGGGLHNHEAQTRLLFCIQKTIRNSVGTTYTTTSRINFDCEKKCEGRGMDRTIIFGIFRRKMNKTPFTVV